MGIIGKFVRTGVVAGAAYAAVKISEKYKANNPGGVPAEDKADAIKEAAKEFFNDVSGKINSSERSGINLNDMDIAGKAQDFVDQAKEKAPAIIDAVADKLQNVADKVAEVVPDLADKIAGAVENVSERAHDFASSMTPEDLDADFSQVVDEQSAEEEDK